MKALFACLLHLIGLLSFSQRTIDVDKQDGKTVNSNNFFIVNGEPFVNVKFTRLVDGSPYFKDEWMKGVASADSFMTYSGILKLDLLDNQIHFLDKNGNEMVTNTRLKKLVLIDTITKKSFTFSHSSSINSTDIKAGWYQLMAEAPSATLYKQEMKILQEIKPYNSATYEQSIRTSNNYFLFTGDKFSYIKKFRDLPDLLQDFGAAHLRHHHVQHDQRWPKTAAEKTQGLTAVPGTSGVVALGREKRHQRPTDRGAVVHHENALHNRPPTASFPPRLDGHRGSGNPVWKPNALQRHICAGRARP